MAIDRVYWENPDIPESNGHIYVCSLCGEHSHDTEWSLTHACNLEILAESKKWEAHYSQEEDL